MPAAPSFALLGEPLALDLVNTRVCRAGRVVDLLDTPAALAAWLRAERGRLAWHGAATPADLRAIRALRAAMDALLLGLRTHTLPPAATLATINRALARRGAPLQLEWSPRGPRAAARTGHARRHALLQALALDIVQLVTGSHAARVRECAHPQCRLQFVAHNPRRRWCSGATCGNRARVARHYLKHGPAR